MIVPLPPPAERLKPLEQSLELLGSLGLSQSKVREIKERLAEARAKVMADGGDPNAAVASLAAVEQEIIDLDFSISTAEFRKQLLARRMSDEPLEGYARALTWSTFDSADRRDRFELVVSRVMLKQTDAPFTMPEREAVDDLLQRLLPAPVQMSDQARADAIMELGKARDNLSKFESLDDLLDQGHYLDVRGYKISLRDRLLDRDVLYAVVKWNAAFLNRIRDLTFAQSRPEYEVDALLRRQADEIDEIFAISTVDKETAVARTNEVRTTVRNSLPQVALANKERAKRELNVDRRVVVTIAAIVGILGAVFIFGLWHDKNDLTELSSAEVREISRYLAKGSVSHGEQGPMFFGEVNHDWQALDDGPKNQAASALLEVLAERNIHDGMIKDGPRVVIQISNGKIRLVESRGQEDVAPGRGRH